VSVREWWIWPAFKAGSNFEPEEYIEYFEHAFNGLVEIEHLNDRYLYEVLPHIYGQFLAFLFYRWEIMMRESATLGILGIYTLGFFIDEVPPIIAPGWLPVQRPSAFDAGFKKPF
jgi:hypothetical protein